MTRTSSSSSPNTGDKKSPAGGDKQPPAKKDTPCKYTKGRAKTTPGTPTKSTNLINVFVAK